MKLQEYVVRCDNCRNNVVQRIEINEKESIFDPIGRKLIGYCLPCGQKEYHTIIEPYFDEEEDD